MRTGDSCVERCTMLTALSPRISAVYPTIRIPDRDRSQVVRKANYQICQEPGVPGRASMARSRQLSWQEGGSEKEATYLFSVRALESALGQ